MLMSTTTATETWASEWMWLLLLLPKVLLAAFAKHCDLFAGKRGPSEDAHPEHHVRWLGRAG